MLVATLAVAAVFVLVVARLPRPLLARYCASFRARHGIGMQISLAVLGTVTTAAVLATAVRPGSMLLELVNTGVVAGLAMAALVDLRRFARR